MMNYCILIDTCELVPVINANIPSPIKSPGAVGMVNRSFYDQILP